MTVGWRSPLGGPCYDGPIPGGERGGVDEWSEERIQAEIEEIERARATAGPEERIRTDGGSHAERINTQLEMAETDDDDRPEVHVGDHVQDRDDEDGATMLVVGTPLETAAEYECNGQTIADYNPDYPAEDDVVEVVYPQRTDVSTRPLERYAFPRARLELAEPIHDRDGGGE